MTRNLDSRTKLTEFAPLSPNQEDNGGLSFIFSKIFKKSQSEGHDSKAETSSACSDLNTTPMRGNSQNYDKKERSYRIEDGELQGRSLPNVLKRISNLVASRNTGRQSYNDTDLKQYWMPDSVSKECYDCGEKFTTFRRRHHCRVCGQIFCSKCCNQEIPGKIINCTGDLRVCTYCGKVVLSYLESEDMRAELSADLRALQDDLQVKFRAGGSLSPNSLLPPSSADQDKETQARRKTSVGYQEEKFATSFRYDNRSQVEEEEKSSLLRLLEEALESSDGVQMASHGFRLRTYHSCFASTHLISWLIANNKANNRVQAVALGQAMLDSGYIEGIETEEFTELDNLYKVSIPIDSLLEEENQNQLSISGSDNDILNLDNPMNHSTSSFNLDLNVEDRIVHITKPYVDGTCETDEITVIPVAEVESGLKEVVENCLVDQPKSMNWDTIEPESLEPIDKSTYFTLQSVYEEHCGSYGRQLLNSEALSQAWIDVIVPLAKQIVYTVRPDLSTMDSLDIRNYVPVKKVSGGERSECTILSGVCCSKNLAHRAMPTSISNPRILLLGCPIAYERIEGRLLSLEPVIMQEQDYVGNTVNRICSLRPDLVLVSRTVCRLAQDALLQAGVSFAVNVKWSTLERLARVTGADILTSVDATLGRPRLATCKQFYLNTFTTSKGSKKTLMIFEGCRDTSLGGTVILRGAPISDLARLKRVLLSLIFAYYNSKLEISYLMDSHALPPSQSALIFDDSLYSTLPSQDISCPFYAPSSVKGSSSFPAHDVPTIVEPVEHVPDEDNNTPNDIKLLSTDKDCAKICLLEECPITKFEVTKEILFGGKMQTPAASSEVEGASVISLDEIRDDSFTDVFTDCSTHDTASETDGIVLQGLATAADCSSTEPSDPLQAYHYDSPTNTEAPTQILSVAELPLCNKFRKALEENILSVSPYLKLSLPYLESEVGRHCPLRCYFGRKLYWSKQLTDNFHPAASRNNSSSYLDPNNSSSSATLSQHANVKFKECHNLVKIKLTEEAESLKVRGLVANYRACGGRIEPRTGSTMSACSVAGASLKGATQLESSLDVLDPDNHQRLPVLFSSYSPQSANAPTFCVDPWVVEMEFYGKYDIALGGFLRRYCFRMDYVCPSESCSVAMLHHTRRFVHQSGALHVNLTRTSVPFKHDAILMWNWCKICNYVSPVVSMSNGTWALSFAKYLELRFHGDMYRLRCEQSCTHSLHHDCVQYFAFKHSIVSFIYQRISTWEICLPPVTVATRYERFSSDPTLEEIKNWTMVAHQIFSSILNKLYAHASSEGSISSLKQQLQKDQSYFKSRIEDLQIKLTSPTLLGEPHTEQVIQEGWEIEDCMVLMKRLLVETVENWNRNLSDLDAAIIRRKKNSETKTSAITGDIIDGMTECEVDVDSPEVLTEGEDAAEPMPPKLTTLPTDCQIILPASSCDFEQPSIITTTDNDEYEGGCPLQLDVKPQTDKKSVKTILSQLLPTQTITTHIPNPMNESEHHMLPLGFSVPVIVYEREPSSIIGYALSSHDYRQQIETVPTTNSPLQKRRSGSEAQRESWGDISSVGLAPPAPTDKRSLLSLLRTSSSSSYEKGLAVGRTALEGTSPNSTFDLDEDHRTTPDLSDSKKNNKTPSPNIDVQFSDSLANFKVKVYFAEDFARLRSLVLPLGEESFVRSLTRCVPWAASGGKSGSTFSKTKDDRFVLKELSRIETHIFLEIAPQYFTYMETCVRTKSPTLLGKILGVYRITYRNHVGSTTYRSNLLVMEHLFHARTVTDKFDLKGSMRNRLVDTKLINSSQRETVLLDQNLINMTCDNPLYILPHSKGILMQAIHNDTQFLASQTVMDYSLLVGLDRTNNELVLGIIDYIRTFTWDKKLETMVKKYGLLGQGKQPTIISPDEYRNRFIAAMHRYFLAVPDRWTGLAQGLGY